MSVVPLDSVHAAPTPASLSLDRQVWPEALQRPVLRPSEQSEGLGGGCAAPGGRGSLGLTGLLPTGLWGWGAVPPAELTPVSSVCSLPGALASSPTSCEYLLGASCPLPGPCWVKRRVGRLLCGDSEWKAAPSVL